MKNDYPISQKELQGSFTIVILAKDEQANIPLVLQGCLRIYSPSQILFVLDGNIEEMAAILSPINVAYMRGPNKGKGAAIRAAVENIDSDILVFMDADGSHDPVEIQNIIMPLIRQEADIVVGSRFLGHSEELYNCVSDYIRFLGNVLGNSLINLVWNRTKTHITDAQNGFRAVNRRVFLSLGLKENGFAIEQEMIIQCLKRRQRIREVASYERRRMHGRSHISFVHFWGYCGCFLRNLFCSD